MTTSFDRTALDALAARLIVGGSRFSRVAARLPGEERPVVAVRTLSTLDHEGPLRVGELAQRERISQPAMTATVNRLEEEGVVRRARDAGDARAVVVALTDRGRAELARFRAASAERVRPALERLSDDDLVVLDRAADLLATLTTAEEPR